MAELTSKELYCIESQLTEEQTIIQKCKMYAHSVSDVELKAKFNDIAHKHLTHYDTLLDMLAN